MIWIRIIKKLFFREKENYVDQKLRYTWRKEKHSGKNKYGRIIKIFLYFNRSKYVFKIIAMIIY